MKYKKIFVAITSSLFFLGGCTKLDETFKGDLSQSQVGGGGSANVDALLKGVYTSMRDPYQGQEQVFALGEMTTDELIGPTRGADWDDNGAWRVLHAHKWTGDNIYIQRAFNGLLGITFGATNLLQYSPSAQQAAEARFLRAFATFDVLDLWDQVPYREPRESLITPSAVRKGAEALDYIISEVKDVMADLPDAPAYTANKFAAKVLLMKCYLNKGAIINRQTPTFEAADMQQVISLADEIINSGKFTLAANYFDNFAPANGNISTENIFTAQNIGGSEAGNVRSRWELTYHYKQKPGGWNGFTTLSDFYSKFDATDQRRGVSYSTPGGLPNPGQRINVGFFVGQQYDLAVDTALYDRTGLPLSFTPEVSLIETGNNLEITGIRVNKYPIDHVNESGGNVDNDYVYYRYADVLLMKAEALLRSGGSASEALDLINQIRVKRGVAPLGSLTLDNLLDERARELYWENYRRQDLIRFGKFLEPWQEKEASDPKYLLLSIPNQQLAVNPNLTQNPGLQ